MPRARVARPLTRPSTQLHRSARKQDPRAADPKETTPLQPIIIVHGGGLSREASEGERALLSTGSPIYQRGAVLVRPISEEVNAADGVPSSRRSCSTFGCDCCSAFLARWCGCSAAASESRQICAARRKREESMRTAWCSPRIALCRSISLATAWPICSWTPCPTTPTRPRAMRCGRACRY